MRRSLMTAAAAALLAAGTGVPAAGAATQQHWRVTYVSPETGYDDFDLGNVVATGAHDAWAVGWRQQGAGSSGVLMRWNGTSWAEVTIPGDPGSFITLDGSPASDVWVTGVTATGANTAWRWDGTSWTATSLGTYDAADVAVVGPRNAWAVGNTGEGSDTGTALHWNGTAWRTVAMPFVARRAAAVSATDVWAVGENATQPLAAHWDGGSWRSVKLPEVPIPEGENGFAYFNDIVATASDDVWAVGRLYWGNDGEVAAAEETEHNRPVLMHWNGHKWSLTLGPEGDFALSAAADGNGGIWYATFNKNYVHVAPDGTTTTVPVPTPDGRDEAPEIRQIAGVPGGTKVLGVGEVAPAPGGDESWDAVIEQYG